MRASSPLFYEIYEKHGDAACMARKDVESCYKVIKKYVLTNQRHMIYFDSQSI